MYGDLLACFAKTAAGGGEPMPVALPGLRMKPPMGQGGTEREHVAVRGAEQTHGRARLAITVISDAAICITVLRMSNNLRQNRIPVERMNITLVPRGNMVVLSSSISAKVSTMSCHECKGYKWQCPTTQSPTQQHNEPQQKILG